MSLNTYSNEISTLSNLVGMEYIVSFKSNIEYLESVVKASESLESPRDRICLVLVEIIGKAKVLKTVFPNDISPQEQYIFPFEMKFHIEEVLSYSKRIAISCENDNVNISSKLFQQVQFYMPKLRDTSDKMIRSLNGERCTNSLFCE